MKTKKEGIGLALSGGGYRATLFHLGGLLRLNELGWLPKLREITSVSGGSIISTYLGLHWKDLKFVKGTADNFNEVIVEPIRDFCTRTIDINSIILGILSPFHHPNQLLAAKYRKYLYGDATLQDLPHMGKGPMFTIYTTSMQTGASVRFCQPYIADYHIGMLKKPEISLADAVAASSGFPPPFCPAKMKFDPSKWQNVEGADLHNNRKLKSLMLLVDGGVYDNIGLERIWDRYEVLLASDAGAPFKIKEDSILIRFSQIFRTTRVLSISHEQQTALRRRALIDLLISKKCKGTYWGIATEIKNYELEKFKLSPPLLNDNARTQALKHVRTRLNSFNKQEQESLINWGYALADAAMRRYVIKGKTAQGRLPYKK